MIAAAPRPSPSTRRSPAAATAGAPARRRGRVAAMAGAAACLCVLLLALSAAQVRPQQAAAGVVVGAVPGEVPGVVPAPGNTAATVPETASGLNAAGQPLLTPTRTVWQGHDLLYEAPQGAHGLVLLLHKCGRSATDFWPRSAACPDCLGLPHSLAKTKQALQRRYAVAAISSLDRREGGGGRCFQWAADAKAAAEVARQLPALLKLPPGAPVYADGASSGGSIALRLPRLAKLDGAIGEVIAPGNFREVLAGTRVAGASIMPPTLYIHMPHDAGMVGKVAENVAALRENGTPVGEIRVLPSPVGPAFFSNCSPLIPPPLSALLHAQLHKGRFLNASNHIIEDLKNSEWGAFRVYMSKQLPGEMQRMQIAIDPAMLYAHVWECLGVAWAVHETVGEYMTAALIWLESRGTVDPALLAQQHRVPRMSALTAVPQTGFAIQSAEEEAEEEEQQQQQQQQPQGGEEQEEHWRASSSTESDEEPQQRAALLKRSSSKRRSKRPH